MRVFFLIIAISISIYSQGQLCNNKEVPGVIINHVAATEGLYIGSPGICFLPDGSYISTHEYFGPGNNNKTSIVQVFLSKDKGQHWTRISKIEGQVWSEPFVLNDTLYMIGPVEYGGDLVIRKSLDGGYTWTTPIDSYSGRLFSGHYHSAPTPVVFHGNRIWKAIEDLDGPKGEKWGMFFRSYVISAPLDSDLMKASSWTITNPMAYNSAYLDGNFAGWLEGNVVVDPNGNIVNILRTDYRKNGDEKASIISISDDGKVASFNPTTGFINYPGGCKKFTIRYDSVSELYWTLSNYVPLLDKGYNPERTRNTQALMCSRDLKKWVVKAIALHHADREKHGFQYIDFQFDGDDIVFVSRTAYDDTSGGANNQHNANYLTFHRIINFRDYTTPKCWENLMP